MASSFNIDELTPLTAEAEAFQLALAIDESLQLYEHRQELQKPNIQKKVVESLEQVGITQETWLSVSKPSTRKSKQRPKSAPPKLGRKLTVSRPSSTTTANAGINKELRLVLVGITGSGKSATGNTILGRDKQVYFKEDTSGKAVTLKSSHHKAVVQNRPVVVIDTPGLFDPERGKDDILREVAKCMSLSAPGPHALILVVSTDRQTEQIITSANSIMGEFKEAWKYTIVLFTGRDNLEHHGHELSHFVDGLPKEMKDVLEKCGNRYLAFNNREKSKEKSDEQVQELFTKIDKMVTANDGYFTSEEYEKTEETIRRCEVDLIIKLNKQMADELIAIRSQTHEVVTTLQKEVQNEKQTAQGAREETRLMKEQMQEQVEQMQESIIGERQMAEQQISEQIAEMNRKICENEARCNERVANIREEVRNSVEQEEESTSSIISDGLKRLKELAGRAVSSAIRARFPIVTTLFDRGPGFSREFTIF